MLIVTELGKHPRVRSSIRRGLIFAHSSNLPNRGQPLLWRGVLEKGAVCGDAPSGAMVLGCRTAYREQQNGSVQF